MTARHGQGFPKAARIRRRREFLSMGRSGEKRRTKSFVFVLRRTAEESRLGLTVSRKVGDAVTRNRLKRRLREAFRRDPDRSSLEHDVVVIARDGVGAPGIETIRLEMASVFASPASR